MTQNNLEVGMRCIKYMLLCVTAILVLTSALIISVGTTIYAIYYDVSFFLDTQLFSIAIFIIVIGVITLFVSLFGCIGALKESTCLVNIFAIILSLVLVCEISVAIAAYTLCAPPLIQVSDMLDTKLRETLPSYYSNPKVTDSFDFIQSRFNCCGVYSYLDWGEVPTNNTGISIANITVPFSCCAQTHYQVMGDVEVDECVKLYANGCHITITSLIYQSGDLLDARAKTMAFSQVIGIVFSFLLASLIRKAKSEHERKRWEIQERMINAYISLNPGKEKNQPIVYVPFQGQTA